jgi:PRTRC genetic system protein E
MFKQLRTLIKARPLTLTVVALEGDRIRVCVIPQSLEADKKLNEKVGHHKEVAKIPEVAIEALTTPLCLEGTAEELDAEMAEKLVKFSESHGVLRGALDRAQQEIAQAVQAIDDRSKAKFKTKQTAAAGKDDKAAHNKDAKGRDSTGEEITETCQSDTLPLEWLAPPSSSPAQDSNTRAELVSEQEAAGQ